MGSILKISKYWVPVFFLVAFLSSLTVSAQDYTDKEIGFDRVAIKTEIRETKKSASNELIEAEASLIREELVKQHSRFLQQRNITPWISIPETAGCTNMGFNSNTDGWGLYWSNGFYNSNNLPSDNTPGTDVYSLLGSTTVSSVPGVNNGNRIAIVAGNSSDGVLGSYIKSATATDNVLRLGQPGVSNAGREEVAKSFTLTDQNTLLRYGYAIVLNDSGHGTSVNPFFSVKISIENDSGAVIMPACATIRYDAFTVGSTFDTSTVAPPTNGVYRFKKWTTNSIDLAQYVDLTTNPVVTISFSISDCAYSGATHEGWAYVEADCLSATQTINVSDDLCTDSSLTFSVPSAEIFPNDTYLWTITNLTNPGAPITATTQTIAHVFSQSGTYNVNFTITRPQGCVFKYQQEITITDCTPCIDCTSFNPIPNEKYLISGWVREMLPSQPSAQYKNYENSMIAVGFKDLGGNILGTTEFYPSGSIIDGWQRIIGEFTVPDQADDIEIVLVNKDKKKTVYFDDIRVFPNRGSMKSFVYDQATHKLMAELDDNNYATFYEYDLEGGLIRIKKETEKGIYTIQEFRTNNTKTK